MYYSKRTTASPAPAEFSLVSTSRVQVLSPIVQIAEKLLRLVGDLLTSTYITEIIHYVQAQHGQYATRSLSPSAVRSTKFLRNLFEQPCFRFSFSTNTCSIRCIVDAELS